MPGASAPGGQADVTRRKADILVDLDRQHREEREDEAGRYHGLLNQLQAILARDPSKQPILALDATIRRAARPLSGLP